MDSLWYCPIGEGDNSLIESDGPSAAPPSISEDEYPDLKQAYARRLDTSRRKERARQQADYEREKEKEKGALLKLLKEPPSVADKNRKASGTRTRKVKKDPGTVKQAKKASLRQDIQYDRDVMNGLAGNPMGIDSDPSSVSIPTSESQLQARFSSSECGDGTSKLDDKQPQQSLCYSPLSFMRDASTIEIPEPNSFWSDERDPVDKHSAGLPLVDNLHFEPQSPTGAIFDFVFSGHSDTQSVLENLPMPFHTNSSPTLSDLTSSGSPTKPYSLKCMAPAKCYELTKLKTPDSASSRARDKFNIEDWQDRLHQKLGIDEDFEIELRSPSTVSSSSKHPHSSAPLQPVSANSANTPKTPTQSAGAATSPPVRKATVSLPKRKESTIVSTYNNPPALHDSTAYKLPTPSPILQHEPSPKQHEGTIPSSPPSSSSGIDEEDGYNTATARRSIASKIFNTFRRRGGGTSLTPYVPTSMVEDSNNAEDQQPQRPRIINRFKRHPKYKPQL